MPAPRPPRGAFSRPGFLAAIAAILFVLAGPAHAGGRGGREPASSEFASPAFRGGDVLAEAARWVGSGKMTGLPGPWCADAISFWLRRTGRRPLHGRMAADALRYGPHLSGPRPGALVVIRTRRGWAGHVGIVEAVAPDGSIRIISGNWGRRVARAIIPRGLAAAFVEIH